MTRKTMIAWAVAALGALLGLIYSGVSTTDFTAHLDRQLHPIRCTLLPGIEPASQVDQTVEGCKVAMFSRYSSFWRDRYWGGIPWSLPGMGLYAFALALCAWALITRRGHEIAPNLGLALTALVAAGTSLVFFYLSATRLDTFCTTCVGSYIGAAILLAAAAGVLHLSRADRFVTTPGARVGGTLFFWIAAHLVEIGVAVALPVVVWAHALPDYGPYVTKCDTLKDEKPPEGVILPLRAATGPAPVDALLVIDPLCPACKALHRRLDASEFGSRLSYRALPLPLDAECNWMLKDSMHPGACLLSRALLCAGDRAADVLDFIYENQEEMRMDGIGKRLDRIRDRVVTRFPDIADCLDRPETKIRLNKALHHVAELALPLLTPQVYLNGRRLCDEDTDLGLTFALTRLIGQGTGGKTP